MPLHQPDYGGDNSKDANDIVTMLTDIAEDTRDISEMGTDELYNVCSDEDLKLYFGICNTQLIRKAFSISESAKIIAPDTHQARKVGSYLNEQNLHILKKYAAAIQPLLIRQKMQIIY